VSLTWRDLIFIAAVIVGMLSLMGGVRYLGRRYAIGPETQRKLVHVATGTAALFFPLLFTNALPVFLLIGAAVVLMLALRSSALASVGGVLHEVKRESWGEIYLALAIAFTFFRGLGEPILYVLPLLVITLSDTASALVGTTYGKRRFTVEDGSKSLEGVVAFFVVTWLVALVTLLLLTDATRVNVVLLSFLVAAFCALVEADSWRGLDNLFVPVGAHLLLQQYLTSSSVELVLIAIGFLLFLGVMLLVADILKLPQRSARGYSILLFLMISLMAPQNAVLTGLVIVGQVWARTIRPGTSQRPELDLLAVAAVVALFWLLGGEVAGRSVLALFNLTFAAVALGFAALATRGWWRLALLPLGATIAGIFLWVSQLNMPWHPPWLQGDWPWLAAALAAPAAAAMIRPELFTRHRSARLFASAMLVPLAFYLKEMIS
jgi:dolichol kinase